jgi:hypothetical protein
MGEWQNVMRNIRAYKDMVIPFSVMFSSNAPGMVIFLFPIWQEQ